MLHTRCYINPSLLGQKVGYRVESLKYSYEVLPNLLLPWHESIQLILIISPTGFTNDHKLTDYLVIVRSQNGVAVFNNVSLRERLGVPNNTHRIVAPSADEDSTAVTPEIVSTPSNPRTVAHGAVPLAGALGWPDEDSSMTSEIAPGDVPNVPISESAVERCTAVEGSLEGTIEEATCEQDQITAVSDEDADAVQRTERLSPCIQSPKPFVLDLTDIR